MDALLDDLADAGHAAFVVGGSLRDALLGRPAEDWDLATDAPPERLLELHPEALYKNRFGTVIVRRDEVAYEITTFRSDHEYTDFRRPGRVEFGTSIEEDLARRDFTVNAMAWGRRPGETTPAYVDPYGGRADVDARLLRAVGDPHARFGEDALRMIRAVRLAATLDFSIDAPTLTAIRTHAGLAAHLSEERVAAELEKLLSAPRPSVGLRLMASTGLLDVVFPELAAQRGVPQEKAAGEDLLDHTLRSVDAAPAGRPIVRLATLLHDLGKPATQAAGHFHGHEVVGAGLAAAFCQRLRMPRAVGERVALLVRHHMFTYEASWSDAAVRRFIRRIGPTAIEELLLLREADSVGSGIPADSFGLTELRERIAGQLAGPVALERGDLAIDGADLIAELGAQPGPGLGAVLDELLERVIADPALNDRPTLLVLAQELLAEEH